MIPKKIHYCWFGRNPKPKLAEKCIKSWKKHCPDYEIIEWNEDNFDIQSAPLYVRQAYEAKKWAFVSDWVRLKIVYDNGGIYLDTDVEVIKKLDSLLDHVAYFGFEGGKFVATGLGFGSERGSDILAELIDSYKEIPFILSNGKYDETTCPTRNTEVFLRHGMKQDGTLQILENNVVLYPSDYFCPKDPRTGLCEITENTYTIHHFDASWYSKEAQNAKKKYWKEVRKEQMRHLPNRILTKLLGKERYGKLKSKLKK